MRVDADDLPGPMYLRFTPDPARLIVTELYLDGRGREITSGLMRSLDLSGIAAVALYRQRDFVEGMTRTAGPDLSVLASHYATGFGSQAKHWVADSMRAQIPGSGVERPKRAKDPVIKGSRRPRPVQPPEGRLTDDFLRSVAENYTWARENRMRPAPLIADQTGYPVRTVRSWFQKARDRDILPPVKQGG